MFLAVCVQNNENIRAKCIEDVERVRHLATRPGESWQDMGEASSWSLSSLCVWTAHRHSFRSCFFMVLHDVDRKKRQKRYILSCFRDGALRFSNCKRFATPRRGCLRLGGLRASWPSLGPAWSRFGAILAHLEVILAHLGPSWGHLRPSWDYLGRSWGHLGPSWCFLGPSWCPSWRIYASSWSPK